MCFVFLFFFNCHQCHCLYFSIGNDNAYILVLPILVVLLCCSIYNNVEYILPTLENLLKISMKDFK